MVSDKVALKVIEKSKLDQKTQRMLTREIANMDIIAHPGIIRLFEVVETLSRIHLVLEFAPGGELFNRVTTEGRLVESEAAYVFSQVVSAIVYLVNNKDHFKSIYYAIIIILFVIHVTRNYIRKI